MALAAISEEAFLERTTACIMSVCDRLVDQVGVADEQRAAAIRDRIEPGKMLRSRLALALCPPEPERLDTIIRACAATELIHTATLFHDDVIDGASLRRGRLPLWKLVGETGAILLGDLFFSAAVELVIESGDLAQVSAFVGKVREVCGTEASHELLLRGKQVDLADSIRIARGKTGGLFAFPASVCGGSDPVRRRAYEEAGYLVGTAYQIADDLVDECGDEGVIGKTLGTDRKRRKFTIAQAPNATEPGVLQEIHKLGEKAVEQVKPWPEAAAGIRQYIARYLTAPMELHYRKAG